MSSIQHSSMEIHVDLSAQKTWVQQVYAWMVGGLMLTGLTAWFVSQNEALFSMVMNAYWLFIIGELGLVFFLSARLHAMSATTATVSYVAYAFLNGLTLSAIFWVYSLGSIGMVFFVAAGMYAAAATYGAVTKRDLTSMGSFMVMGLFGIIVTGMINWFVGSPAIDWAISVAGVLVFVGLTAWDMQKIKNGYLIAESGEDVARKGAIMGALALYLDFINLFLFLLRLLGGRRD
jgi:hypothetical protein